MMPSSEPLALGDDVHAIDIKNDGNLVGAAVFPANAHGKFTVKPSRRS
ncbi:MAG TPA: hypothetical protein VFN13_03600 [Rudaea sp.]|nr:hypothetical protein [Rudaea sp.]